MTQQESIDARNRALATLKADRKIHIDGFNIVAHDQLSKRQSGAVDMVRKHGYVVKTHKPKEPEAQAN